MGRPFAKETICLVKKAVMNDTFSSCFSLSPCPMLMMLVYIVEGWLDGGRKSEQIGAYLSNRGSR